MEYNPFQKAWWKGLLHYITEQMKDHDASHDVHHVLKVTTNVQSILCKEITTGWNSVEVDAALVAAMCHELCDTKYVTNKVAALHDMRDKLYEIGVPANVIAIVYEVVPVLSFTRRMKTGIPTFSCESSKRVYLVVSDADYLEAIGMTGIIRTYSYRAVRGDGATDATHHIENNLYSIPDYISSEWALKAAHKRIGFMKIAMRQYRSELEEIAQL